MKKVKLFKIIMLFWTLFIGVGAVSGATGMLVEPDGSALGMQTMLPYFQVLPFAQVLFSDYIFAGIALLIVNGISNLTAAVLIIANKKAGAVLGFVFGITLMLWIVIQFIILPANFLSTAYFIFGALQFICGIAYYVFFNQKAFIFNASEYKSIGKSGKELVVFFSREGYCKKVAYDKADELGADIYEITSGERTKGYPGFWWCGRFGMHGWNMPVNDINIDVSQYEKVIIVTPIWVFSVCGPVRDFCAKCNGKIRKAEYISLHFTKSMDFESSFDIMDNLLGIKAEKCTSLTSKFGKIVKEVVAANRR